MNTVISDLCFKGTSLHVKKQIASLMLYLNQCYKRTAPYIMFRQTSVAS